MGLLLGPASPGDEAKPQRPARRQYDEARADNELIGRHGRAVDPIKEGGQGQRGPAREFGPVAELLRSQLRIWGICRLFSHKAESPSFAKGSVVLVTGPATII